MTLDAILTELRAERDRLNRAIVALEGVNSASPTAKRRKRGRPKMSAEARKQISEAKKKWWADRKKKSK